MSAETDILKSLKKWIATSTLLLGLGISILAWKADQDRQHNCHLVERALDAYTEGLIKASATNGQEPKTPQEKAQFDDAFDALTSTYRPVFDECR